MPSALYPSIDLMIGGAQKAGTSSLKEYLGQHPQICTHTRLEMTYFVVDEQYKLGYEHIFPRYFRPLPTQQLILAKSVDIMYSAELIERYKKHNPNGHIVVLLRNPTDRAYSAYWHHRRNGWETLPTFEEAISAGTERFGADKYKRAGCAYIERGLYIKHIQMLYKYFSRDQIHIFLLDDMKINAARICQQIYALFPNIDQTFTPDVRRKTNEAAVSKNQFIANVMSSPNQYRWIKTLARKLIPDQYIDQVTKKINSINEFPFAPLPMKPDTQIKLVEYFKPYNQELAEFLHRDLSAWNSIKRAKPQPQP